jgi:hypothetical protein
VRLACVAYRGGVCYNVTLSVGMIVGKVLRVQLCWLKLTHGFRIVHLAYVFDGVLDGKNAKNDIYLNAFNAS